MNKNKYLELLQRIIWEIRLESRKDKNIDKIYKLADVVENIPGLLECSDNDSDKNIDNKRLLVGIVDLENEYYEGENLFSEIIR